MSKKQSIKTYDVHPAAELFPLMTDEEFAGLKEDIRLHGQCDDVLIWDGKLLDGRNRLRACIELGIEPGWAELPKRNDPVAWVLSNNLHRRHLNTAQRAMVAQKLATLMNGANQHTKEGAQICAPSQTQAAGKLNVSRRAVQTAKTIATKAKPAVVAAVEAGTMSLNAAAATIKPEKPKQKNGTEKVSAAKLVDALTRSHIGHIARGLTAIATANGGEGKQFNRADSNLNQMITALQAMREGER